MVCLNQNSLLPLAYNPDVARIHDWVDLGRNTLSGLTTDEVTSLYSREWAETRDALMAEHRESIAQERRPLLRGARSLSAMLYGLVKRLSPARRIVFLVSFFVFFIAFFRLLAVFRNEEPPFRFFSAIAMSFLLMTLLLAMELIGKIKMRDELTLARDLQATLIPRNPPRTPEYEIAAFNYIANTVGGDLYDFALLPDGRLAVLFGDASGHGMAAGLVMAVAHASFRTQLDVDPEPQAIFGSLNRILCRTGTSRSFFSCCYVLFSPDGTYRATFAGHPPMLHVSAGGKVTGAIGRGSYPLGIKDALRWEEIAGSLAKGERLVLHSDGLVESRNERGRDFGDAYAETVINWNGTAPGPTLVNALVEEWRKFTVHTQIEDDVSIAVIERKL